MCPDFQLYSAYYDAEIPSPWDKKIAAHIASCPSCQARFKTYQKLSETIATDMPECGEDFLNASFERLTDKIGYGAFTRKQNQQKTPVGFIPVRTVKIAAAAIFIAAFLPASFLLGKAVGERDNMQYFAVAQQARKTNIQFPPQHQQAPLQSAFSGTQVSNNTLPIPVYEPGRGIVIQKSPRLEQTIIISVPDPDFSAFSVQNQGITEP